MLWVYLLIALGTIAAIAGVYAVLCWLDKKGGEKRTMGLLKLMAVFKATDMVDHMQRRIR